MRPRNKLLAAALLTALGSCTTASAQGIIVPAAGGMHSSMGGASTAQGADALGALYWNPAAISWLPRSEVVIGGNAVLANTHLGSRIPAHAFGPLGPEETLAGETRSDSGVSLLSGLGFVYKQDGSPITFGLGMATLAGGGVNFPGDVSNPILAPTGPFNNVVLGPQAASLMIASIMPTASYQLSETLAIGVGPMIDVSVVSFDPAFFTAPNDANGDGLFSFPTGSHSQPFWGGGFRAGVSWRCSECLTFGFSFTSPQWFQTWKFNARNEVGDPYTFSTKMTLPTILSTGVSYTGIDRLMLNADVRWFDYANADLWGDDPRNGGAGWRSIWSLALGGRYQVSEQCSVQAGYIWNQNPIPENLALFNTMLPCITQNTLSLGGYYQLNESFGLSLAYIHGFENSISGTPFQLLKTSTTISTEYDALAFGIHIRFGGPTCTVGCTSPAGGTAVVQTSPTLPPS